MPSFPEFVGQSAGVHAGSSEVGSLNFSFCSLDPKNPNPMPELVGATEMAEPPMKRLPSLGMEFGMQRVPSLGPLGPSSRTTSLTSELDFLKHDMLESRSSSSGSTQAPDEFPDLPALDFEPDTSLPPLPNGPLPGATSKLSSTRLLSLGDRAPSLEMLDLVSQRSDNWLNQVNNFAPQAGQHSPFSNSSLFDEDEFDSSDSAEEGATSPFQSVGDAHLPLQLPEPPVFQPVRAPQPAEQLRPGSLVQMKDVRMQSRSRKSRRKLAEVSADQPPKKKRVRGKGKKFLTPIIIPPFTGEVNISLAALKDLPSDLYNRQFDDVITIGEYTKKQRRAKIERFKLKRRNYEAGKPLKSHYKSRKNFAVIRPRIGGRFAKLTKQQRVELTAASHLDLQ